MSPIRTHLCLRLSLAMATASLVLSCRATSAGRFEGRWRGVRVEGVGPEALQAASAFAVGTRLDVKGETLAISTTRDRQLGRYRVVDQTDDAIVITTDKDGPGDPVTFAFVGNQTMKWSVLDGKSIVFTRE